jgi:hypothetical protein
VSWEQLWYTLCGLAALAGARLLDRWLPPHPPPATTVVVNAPLPDDDDDGDGRHRKG